MYKTQLPPHRKRYVSIMKSDHLMLIGREWPFIVSTVQNTQIHYAGKVQCLLLIDAIGRPAYSNSFA